MGIPTTAVQMLQGGVKVKSGVSGEQKFKLAVADSWIQFVVVDNASGEALCDLPLAVTTSDGRVFHERTNGAGLIELYSIASGSCTLGGQLLGFESLAIAGLFASSASFKTEPRPQGAAKASKSHKVTRGGRDYLVKKDDNLWDLSERFYGDGNYYEKIKKENPTIGDDNGLAIGMVLKVPQLEVDSWRAVADVDSKHMAIVFAKDDYAIEGKPGNDTLMALASKYALSWRNVAEVNWGAASGGYFSPDIVRAPNVLYLPKAWKREGFPTGKVHMVRVDVAWRKPGVVGKILSEAGVVRRSTWGKLIPNYAGMQLDWGYDTIVIHHSGDEWFGHKDPGGIEKEHDGKDDVGYHFMVEKDGKIYEARSLLFKGEHVDKANTKKIGVLVMGDYHPNLNGVDDLTNTQMNAVKALVKALVSNLSTVNSILGHRDVNPGHTDCPGDNLYARLGEIRKSAGM